MLLQTSQATSAVRSTEEQMMLIRLLENRLQELCLTMPLDLHFSRGQEAISVGAISALRPTDYIVAHHRTIAHAVAKGVPLEPLVAELLGKATGINGGFAGEMHMSYPEKRFMFSFQLVGTCVPVAAGLAWAVKHHTKEDAIVACFHGDAATANGQWHEGVNLAAVMNLPLLLVCENNHLAGNVRADHYLPTRTVSHRAQGYGIQAACVDGNDIKRVTALAQEGITYIRHHSKPFLLECETARLGRHKQGMGDIRTKTEMEALMAHDPIRKISLDASIMASLKKQVDDAVAFALASPNPTMPKEKN